MIAPDVECAQKTSLPHSCMMFHYVDSPEGREAGASWGILQEQLVIGGSYAKFGVLKNKF